MSKNKLILVTSGFGGNTREPFVMMECDALDRPLQMDPESARELGLNLLEAAEAALGDAFLVGFIVNELNGNDNIAANILMEFRKFREKRDEN